MPTISVFYGILIQMFWRDHAPPHFHALYAEDEALIDIRTFVGGDPGEPAETGAGAGVGVGLRASGRIDGGLEPVRTESNP